MRDETARLQAVAHLVAALVHGQETTDVLADLMEDCARLYPAAAVAVLVKDRFERLELLAASSHHAEEVELLQLQQHRGPCVDTVTTGEVVSVSGVASLAERWGDVGERIAAAGYSAVRGYPLRWQGTPLGGLNVFLAQEPEDDADAHRLGQLFADVATLSLVSSGEVPLDQVAARVHEAVNDRSLVEQAKGVVAYEQGVGMGTAYDLLLAQSHSTATTLSEVARRTVARARRPPEPREG